MDTAPWYGQGLSECVIGLALNLDLLFENDHDDATLLLPVPCHPRQQLFIQSKVGRYSTEEEHMFDFSAERVRQSVMKSLERMQCGYLDVLQLHDPEFSPSLDLLVEETIPEMVLLKKEGLVKAIGVTGYPLEIQQEIF